MKTGRVVALFAAIFVSACATQSSTKRINIIDSLEIKENLGEITENRYEGELNDTTFILTIFHQKHSGDGVYSLQKKFNKTTSIVYGKRYTLRGDATNIDAVVYELKPYEQSQQPTYFRQNINYVELLDKDLKNSDLKLQLKDKPL